MCRVRRALQSGSPLRPRSVSGLLYASSAQVQCVAGQARHVERVHDRDRVGKLFSSCGLEPGEPVHRDDLDRSRHACGRPASQVLKTCLTLLAYLRHAAVPPRRSCAAG